MPRKKSARKKATKKSARRATKKPKLALESGSSSSIDNMRLAAILQYFFPIGLIWFLVDDKVKSNKFVKFHLKQSLVLVALWVIWGIICEILWRVVSSFGWFIQLAIVVLAIVGILNAYKGKKEELPLVGSYAEHFKF